MRSLVLGSVPPFGPRSLVLCLRRARLLLCAATQCSDTGQRLPHRCSAPVSNLTTAGSKLRRPARRDFSLSGFPRGESDQNNPPGFNRTRRRRGGQLYSSAGRCQDSMPSYQVRKARGAGRSARKNLPAVSHLPDRTGNGKLPKTGGLPDLPVGKPIQI